MELSKTGSQQSKLTQTSSAIFPVAYLPPINHFIAMLAHEEFKWDTHEFYHKQFYYNRCNIYGPNGTQTLTIPVHKRFEKTPLKDITIVDETPWQKIHWRSYEAAYRRSPYFEYYEGELYSLYWEYKAEYLLDWNIKLLEIVFKLMETNLKLSFTDEYFKSYENLADYRNLASPQEAVITKEIKYQQVFEERNGFIPNLSIIDLLFSEGPHAKELLIN